MKSSYYSVGFLLFAVLLVSVTTCCCHGWLMPAASRTPAPSSKAKTKTTRTARRAALQREVPDGEGNEKWNVQVTRREALRDAFVTSTATAVATTGVVLFSSPSWSVAAAEEVQSSSSSSSASNAAASSEILLRLRSIPVFSIVDPNGVPFMIFDGQAKATGYFFLSFDIAAQALQDARQKDKNTGAAQVWANAKIIVVPLAVALQLSLRKSQREAINGNGIKFNTFNDLVPSQEGVDDAKALDNYNPAKWEQKGRVPLFYIKGLTLDDGKEPRYFNQRDLLQEWERQQQQQQPPTIQIVEMVDLYRAALSSSSNGNSLDAISNLAIMPVAESNQVASKLLIKSDGTLPSYSFNKVFLVGSAKG